MPLIEPGLPPERRVSFTILAPTSTHWRQAKCSEVDCPHYKQGWQSRVDTNSDRGAAVARYIRKDSGRSFTEQEISKGVFVFTFEAGQMCFQASDHKVRLEREEIFLVRGGDHRGNPRREVKQLMSPQWVETFAEHQQALADRLEQG